MVAVPRAIELAPALTYSPEPVEVGLTVLNPD